MTILIIRHVENNSLDALEPILQERRQPFRYLHGQELSQQPEILTKGIRALMTLGGQESVTNVQQHPFMQAEQTLLQQAMQQNIPILGICLGAQILAHSLGAPVEKNQVAGHPYPEIGWTPIQLTPAGQTDSVLSSLENQAQFQWHEDTFHLPETAIRLAYTEHCAQQAFQVPHPAAVPIYGVQFHPEISLPAIQIWLNQSQQLPASRKTAIWEESQIHFATWHQASQQLFRAFLDQALSVSPS